LKHSDETVAAFEQANLVGQRGKTGVMRRVFRRCVSFARQVFHERVRHGTPSSAGSDEVSVS
jgi:hypothetical protein